VITGDGDVPDDSTAEFLRHYMTELLGFSQRVYTVLPQNA